LEYGSATVELQKDAFEPGTRVMIIDDLLATGGTALASVELVRSLGGVVTECVFVTELGYLDGRKNLEAAGVTVRSLVVY
jgi:adenine phosphoribosyltransferase